MKHNNIKRATDTWNDDEESQKFIEILSQCDISEFLGETKPNKSNSVKQDIKQEISITPQKLITQKELAAALSVSVQTVRSWKECPRVYMGKRANGKGSACRYDLAEVIAWLRENRSAYRNADKTWMQAHKNRKEEK